jgi:hypothetical protein
MKPIARLFLQASRGARKYAGENFLRHLVELLLKLSPHSCGNAPGPRQLPRHLLLRYAERLHQRHDGRLSGSRCQDSR